VDAYNRLSRKRFCDLLAKLEGVKSLKRIFLPSRNFCKFEYDGSNFTIEEDSYDYWYNIKPENENIDAIKKLETYFLNQDIPEYKVRSFYLFLALFLLGLFIYIDLQCS